MQLVVDPVRHTTSPLVTGGSVIGIKCSDGVVIAADTLASYGSLARFQNFSRLLKVTDSCLLGGGGEISDFQEIQRLLENLTTQDFCFNDEHKKSPRSLHQYLGRVLYAQRSRLNPFWNSLIVGGYVQSQSFLGMVDLYGTTFESEVLASGFGVLLGLPLLRKAYRPDLTVQEGIKIVEEVYRVLFYRDARSINRIQVATATVDGVTISEPYSLETKWDFKGFVNPRSTYDESTW
ncbi:20S proteasome subunit beta 7 [Galdieria sulphuraria]|uniref:Proteasome subunit beta n=1 Tax=Galdieria sulphuraria TaxID=130081 RepID=M2W1N9_GALSU|nr:20S proteasome subunit beta 7 [Galdieria sulphuraria]EME29591.1 20S proteasome subunit beta 7 [Galdieria sulphuraria]|eukprot:XP_005706111.1 20S proteasome subunit beta 7 [Galdieria sulphuraria]